MDNLLVRVSSSCNNLNDGKAKFISFIPEEVGYDTICIGMDPLAVDENIEKQKRIVKEVRPKIALEFACMFYSFIKDPFSQLERGFLPAQYCFSWSRQFRKYVIVKVADAFQCLKYDTRDLFGAFDRLIVK